MKRMPWLQFAFVLVASAIVLGLFAARGFSVAVHTRIMLGAATLVWLVGGAWTLATAAESSGGWKRIGVGGVLVVLAGSAGAAYLPALALAFWSGTGAP